MSECVSRRDRESDLLIAFVLAAQLCRARDLRWEPQSERLPCMGQVQVGSRLLAAGCSLLPWRRQEPMGPTGSHPSDPTASFVSRSLGW